MNFEMFRVKVKGDYACFARPEMKVERVSYDIITPSAARGVIEAIFWKPSISWVIDRIDLLSTVRWESFRRNEVSSRASSPPKTLVDNGGLAQLSTVIIEDDRQQRASLILRDVSYVIHCHFEFTSKRGEDETASKFSEMFKRRLKKGQCHHQPYLGCREFSCDFIEAATEDIPQPEILGDYYNRHLGYMLHDIDFTNNMTAKFFEAQLVNGSVLVPPFNGSEVRA